MKLVKEYINEKFTEKSDPIYDIGIGIPGMIEEIRKKIKKVNTSVIADDEDVFLYCLYKEEDLDLAFAIIEYFLKKKKEEIYGHLEDIFTSFKRDHHVWEINAISNRRNNKEFKDRILTLIMNEAKKDKDILNTLMLLYFNFKNYKKVEEMIEMGADPTIDNNKLIKKAIDKGNKKIFDIAVKYVKWK